MWGVEEGVFVEVDVVFFEVVDGIGEVEGFDVELGEVGCFDWCFDFYVGEFVGGEIEEVVVVVVEVCE